MVAVHSSFEYSLVRYKTKYAIIASNLLAAISTQTKTDLTPLATIKGSDLVGLTYTHPFLEKTNPIISADFVNLEDGTGMVHIAPGHGTDDYLAGQANNLDTYCPVQADGTYDTTVPKWLQGLSI